MTTRQITSEHGAQKSELTRRRRQHSSPTSSSRASKWPSRSSACCPRPRRWRRSNLSAFFRSQVAIMPMLITYTPTCCTCSSHTRQRVAHVHHIHTNVLHMGGTFPQKKQFQRILRVCSLCPPPKPPPLSNSFVFESYLVRARACVCKEGMCQKRPSTVSKETYYSVKRDLVQCQKIPSTVSKETYYSVKRDLLQCQKRPTTVSKMACVCKEGLPSSH